MKIFAKFRKILNKILCFKERSNDLDTNTDSQRNAAVNEDLSGMGVMSSIMEASSDNEPTHHGNDDTNVFFDTSYINLVMPGSEKLNKERIDHTDEAINTVVNRVKNRTNRNRFEGTFF